MAAEARRETRQGAEGNEEGDGGDGAQDSERVGFIIIIRPPLLLPIKLVNKILCLRLLCDRDQYEYKAQTKVFTAGGQKPER